MVLIRGLPSDSTYVASVRVLMTERRETKPTKAPVVNKAAAIRHALGINDDPGLVQVRSDNGS